MTAPHSSKAKGEAGLVPDVRDGVVFCVDMDGTLFRNDIVLEQFNQLFFHKFRTFSQAVRLFLKDKVLGKKFLAEQVPVESLPLTKSVEVLELIQKAKADGQKIILVTGAAQEVAEAAVKDLELFDEIHGSSGAVNLTRTHKGEFLQKRYGKEGFDYVGNSHADLAAWSHCRRAYLVNADWGVSFRLAPHPNFSQVKLPGRIPFKAWVDSLRMRQWFKNLLVFTPIIASHSWTNWEFWKMGLVAFITLNFLSSAIYIFNDLKDVSADRLHPTKRNRPLAAAELDLRTGWALALGLISLAFGCCLFLPEATALFLGVQLALSLLYLLKLKHMPVLDIFVLCFLHVNRALVGGAATGIELSSWFLGVLALFFLSLACLKRFAELKWRSGEETDWMRYRGYLPGDATFLAVAGIGSGMLTVLVLLIYLTQADVIALYPHKQVMLLFGFVSLWFILRLWFLGVRGVVHDDPLLFIVEDTGSRWGIVVLLVLFYLASTHWAWL